MKWGCAELATFILLVALTGCDAQRTLVQGDDERAFFPDLRVSVDAGKGPAQLDAPNPNWPLSNHVVIELDLSKADADDTAQLTSSDVIELGGTQIHGPGPVALAWSIKRVGVDAKWGGALNERWFFAVIFGLALHEVDLRAHTNSLSAEDSSSWVGLSLGGEIDLRIATGLCASLRVVNDAGGGDTHLADGELGIEWRVPKTAFALFVGLRKWAYQTSIGIDDFELSTGGPELSLRASF